MVSVYLETRITRLHWRQLSEKPSKLTYLYVA